jgi:hypothetical protein
VQTRMKYERPIMLKFETSAAKRLSPRLWSREILRPVQWRALGYWLVILLFFMLIIAAWLRPDFNRPKVADWNPVLARADHAREAGDLQRARHLYLKVERIASWNRDWQGTVAAACRFNKLDGVPARHSKAYTLLIRAGIFAQEKQSRQAMATIAEAFNMLGQHQTASLFLVRIGASWPSENSEPLEFLLEACLA